MILGTDGTLADTDGDGVSDGVEVLEGGNPLDGLPVAQGILAAVGTFGSAVDVAAFDGVALVAEGVEGVSILDTTDALNPVRLTQVDTPGDALGVSFEGGWGLVADGAAGVAVIDLRDPLEPVYLHQVSVGGVALSVVVGGRLGWVGLEGGGVAVVDLVEGELMAQRRLGTGRVMDLVLVGDYLYAYTPGRVHVLERIDLEVLGSVEVPGVIGVGGLGVSWGFGGGGFGEAFEVICG